MKLAAIITFAWLALNAFLIVRLGIAQALIVTIRRRFGSPHHPPPNVREFYRSH